MMNEYYFTYGTDSAFPFCGGYTKVIAKTMKDNQAAVDFISKCTGLSVSEIESL